MVPAHSTAFKRLVPVSTTSSFQVCSLLQPIPPRVTRRQHASAM